MNQPFLGDHRPASILRDMTPRQTSPGNGRLAVLWFSIGVIVASVGFYMAGHV